MASKKIEMFRIRVANKNRTTEPNGWILFAIHNKQERECERDEFAQAQPFFLLVAIPF